MNLRLLLTVALFFNAWQLAAAQQPVSKSAAFYRADEVQSVYVQVAQADLQRMQAALPKRISVPAKFRWNDITIENVALRYKGNSSSSPMQQHKRSFLIKFNEYNESQRFLDLRRVSFDNGVQFGSVFSEPIITDILRDLGIPTHRCNYAKLYVNDEYQGVYVNVERIDESFLENHLPDKNGLLFKVDEGGPGADLRFLGDEPSAYARAFEPETKVAKKGQRQLVDFLRMINQAGADDFATAFDAKMESDDFLKVTAVLLFSGAFDQLTGFQPHNYYLYQDTNTERWRYLPWDLDVGFCEVAFGRIPVLADWNAAWPMAGQQPNPLLERIVADPVLLARYRKTARAILDQYFEPDHLCAVVDAKYALIKDGLQTDPFPHRRVTNPTDRGYDDIVASIKTFIKKRHAAALAQLENPGKRPEMKPRLEGPQPPIVAKIQRLQRAAERMQRDGKDISPIQKLMGRIGPLLQQGQMEAAEKLVDEALKRVNEKPVPTDDKPTRDK